MSTEPPVAPAAARRGRWRRLAALAAGNLAVLLVLLVAAEFVYRWLYPNLRSSVRTFPAQHQNRTNWARADPELGWVFSGTAYHTFLRP
jgi:hypothetical protein